MVRPLPRYKKPPVVETVLGVEFKPLDKWDVVHFGLFWQDIRQQFPGHQIQAPLASNVETFGLPAIEPQTEIRFPAAPDVRCWYLSSDNRQLIQVQRDRFLFNWRKLDLGESYPGYEEFVRPAFERNWQLFSTFLAEQGLPAAEVIQCEVNYINHIAPNGWRDAGDWHSVFTFLKSLDADSFLPSPESAVLHFNYVMPNQQGRLRVSANRAIRRSDLKEIIALSLVARGKPQSSSLNDIVAWLNMGREWVVRGFTDITTSGMQKEFWKREV